MNLETLKKLLNISNRNTLYDEILKDFRSFNSLEYVQYNELKISDGIIPVLKVANNLDINEIKTVKLFIGAQHNEYNGLFGILDFFKILQKGEIKISDTLKNTQILIFMPLMNPYGFLNPQKNNKSGYYLRNGENLNRFWRRAFVPEFENGMEDLDELPSPEQVKIVKDLLDDYWRNEKISIYILDFHETSLIERFPIELNQNFSPYYKFDHWLKEGIIYNIIKLNNIRYSRKPLFVKCNPSADHTHINLTYEQVENVSEKLQEYLSKNLGVGKLPFYFCYGNKSRDYCRRLANLVYDKLKGKLWETYFPAFDHSFINHGCFINMSDATARKNVISMELESQKQFFNIFDEIEKSKSELNYFEKKLDLINLSIELALETIKEMINLI
ncbi:MAG: hypothetical protein ACFE8L_02720 [Candidatus Hodarchaeota archaeon]